MQQRHVTDLYIYPVKSMGGIRLEQSHCEQRGLQYDRRWMLVDRQGRFVSQREHSLMSRIKISITASGFKLSYEGADHEIPRSLSVGPLSKVAVWDDICQAIIYDSDTNHWLSELLHLDVRLAYQADEDTRTVDPGYARNGELTSLSDGYPYLFVGQPALDLLNEQLTHPVAVDRFRPNVVFAGGAPHEEDRWSDFTIGGARFYGAKPCSRCQVITIDQQSGVVGKEPLKTLAGYRNFDHKIKFGMNVLCAQEGVIKVGDEIILM